MAQSTILAAGVTAATSTDVVVTTAAPIAVGAFVASGTIPHDTTLQVMADTPGGDVLVAALTMNRPAINLTAPGTYRVVRPALPGTAVGVYSEP